MVRGLFYCVVVDNIYVNGVSMIAPFVCAPTSSNGFVKSLAAAVTCTGNSTYADIMDKILRL